MNKKGFTLLEVVIYLAIIAILLPLLATLVLTFHTYKQMNAASIEIEDDASALIGFLRHELNSAIAIDISSSVLGEAYSVLVYTDQRGNRVTLDASGTPRRLRLQRGTDSAVWVTGGEGGIGRWQIDSVRNGSGGLKGLRFLVDLSPVVASRLEASAAFSSQITFALPPTLIEI